MDDQQHALSALLRTVAIAEADEPPGPGEPPRAWLWLAALVACWNPPRAALAVPRLGRTRREVMTVAAVGGLVAGTAVVILAALSGPLRDALDVSRPALRIAVGVIAAATGVVDLVRRAPAGEPALGGWRAALVPVAVPVVARPALLLMAISAGADQGAGVAAGAAAVAAGALMALAVAPPEGVSRTASSWAGALLGACLVAAGAALVVNGVLDV
jgi:small neutral amino acid transporter SnatA (MarC family)